MTELWAFSLLSPSKKSYFTVNKEVKATGFPKKEAPSGRAGRGLEISVCEELEAEADAEPEDPGIDDAFGPQIIGGCDLSTYAQRGVGV